MVEALGGGRSTTGASINETSVLGISAVYSCVRLLADSVASLPLMVYKREGRGKSRATDHPLYALLHDQPNPWMTPYQFKETMMGHVLLWGNFYAYVDWGNDGKPRGIWPLRPNDMVRIDKSASGDLLYTYRVPSGETGAGELRALTQREVFHLRGLSPDGIRGYAPITLHRESLGLAMATEEYGARWFSNDSTPGGVLQTKARLSDVAAARLKESWEASKRGLSERHRIAVLEEGVEFHQISIPPNDAQWLESRTFSLDEIARIFRVPPHKIGELSHATYTNIDKQEQAFKGDSLEPWLVRSEEQATISFLTPAERTQYFVEYLMDAQWRADILTRYEAYARGKQWGWLSTNDIREMENLNPVENGDEYWQPVNMMEMGTPLGTLNANTANTNAGNAGEVVREIQRDSEGRLIGVVERQLRNPSRAWMYDDESEEDE